MTRFARSKGSKSCNERVPETGTSWGVMKKQLEISQKEARECGERKKAEEQRIQNYEQFLKEERSKNSTSTWCEFPEKELDAATKMKVKKKKKLRKSFESSDAQNPIVFSEASQSTECHQRKKKKKNLIKDTFQPNLTNESIMKNNENISIQQNKNKKQVESIENTIEIVTEHKQKKKKRKINQILSPVDCILEETTKELKVSNDSSSNDMKKKKQKKKHLKNGTSQEPDHVIIDGYNNKIENNELGMENIYKSNHNQKIGKKKGPRRIEGDESAETRSMFVPNVKRLKKKNADGSLTRRKPLEDRSFTLIVGGEELEVTRFDGFPVLAKDAHRLKELQQSMKSKGIPKSEIFRTMKLERRRAEKNLTRMKKVVCFNCRKGGHLLAECPEIGNTEGGMPMTGLCFKCGSTEHKSYECKVQKSDDFKFSKCFICKEQGHIARQCPDHPKGLFPNGGACKLCGDVTHFKKDCPMVLNNEEDNKLTLDTLEQHGNLDEIETKAVVEAGQVKKKVKLVKF